MESHSAIIHYDGDGLWMAFPDFPELATDGEVGKDDPADLASQALADAIAFRRQEGRPAPAPSRVEMRTFPVAA